MAVAAQGIEGRDPDSGGAGVRCGVTHGAAIGRRAHPGVGVDHHESFDLRQADGLAGEVGVHLFRTGHGDDAAAMLVGDVTQHQVDCLHAACRLLGNDQCLRVELAARLFNGGQVTANDVDRRQRHHDGNEQPADPGNALPKRPRRVCGCLSHRGSPRVVAPRSSAHRATLAPAIHRTPRVRAQRRHNTRCRRRRPATRQRSASSDICRRDAQSAARRHLGDRAHRRSQGHSARPPHCLHRSRRQPASPQRLAIRRAAQTIHRSHRQPISCQLGAVAQACWGCRTHGLLACVAISVPDGLIRA